MLLAEFYLFVPKLEKKIILITGVSSGFGRVTAMHLAEAGHLVYGSIRRKVDGIPHVNLIDMDVTNMVSVQNVVDTIVTKEGRIDVLINNAGMGIAGAVEETSQEESDIQMNTNFNGTVRAIKAVLPYMRRQQSGTIINISSIGGLMGLPFQGFYSASKFAVEGYSQSLRMELKPFNIHVVVVNPGDFTTKFTANRKIIASAQDNTSYLQFNVTLKAIEKDENSGLNPIVLAKKISRIVSSAKPSYRYIVSSPIQRLSVILSHILPGKCFGRMIENYYGIR